MSQSHGNRLWLHWRLESLFLAGAHDFFFFFLMFYNCLRTTSGSTNNLLLRLNAILSGMSSRMIIFFVMIAVFVQVAFAGTCVCSNGAKWQTCPNGSACHSFCVNKGGTRFWGGPGRSIDTIALIFMLVTIVVTFAAGKATAILPRNPARDCLG